jgi:hypothetical protein
MEMRIIPVEALRMVQPSPFQVLKLGDDSVRFLHYSILVCSLSVCCVMVCVAQILTHFSRLRQRIFQRNVIGKPMAGQLR